MRCLPLPVLLLLPLSMLVATSCGDEIDLTIVHLNDTHSHLDQTRFPLWLEGMPAKLELGGFPRLVAKVRQERWQSENPLVLHAGDAFQGSLHFVNRRGLSDAELAGRGDAELRPS